MSEDHTETMGGMFDRGLKLRREVLGVFFVCVTSLVPPKVAPP